MLVSESTVDGPRVAGNSRADDYPISRAYAWYLLAILMLLMIFGLMDRMIIGTLFPQLKQEWGLNDTELGLLVSATYWSMAIFVIPAAVLVDRWSRTRAIALMAMVWTLATVACGLAGGFFHLLAARFFIGAGEGGYNAGAVSMISGVFPERLRTTAVSLFVSAGSLGSVIGVAVGGYVVTHWGWREAFFVVAVPGFVVVLLFMLTARDFRTVALEVRDADGNQRKLKPSELLRGLFATPSLCCLYIGISGVLFINAAIVAWAPALFNRMDRLPMDQAAMRSAFVLLAATVGAILGGMLVDRLKANMPRALMLGPAVYTLISGLAFVFGLTQFTGDARFAVLLLGAFFMSASFGPMFAASQTVVHAGLRATTVGVINVIGQLIGGTGAIVAGALSDAMGIDLSLAAISGALLISAVALWAGSRHYVRDVEKIPQIRIVAADPAQH